MKYYLFCFQTSGRLIIFFNKHDYQVLTSLIKQNKRYKRLKTAKWVNKYQFVLRKSKLGNSETKIKFASTHV